MSGWAVRVERPGDEAVIAALTAVAFAGHPHSDGGEPAIVERLRASGDLALSLVVEDAEGILIGHAAFSPVALGDGTRGWFGLGPISVAPARQREGIGSALVRDGLAHLQARDAAGCVVLGDPAYYGRFGFTNDPALTYPGPAAKYFQRLVLRGEAPSGEVRYTPAFG